MQTLKMAFFSATTFHRLKAKYFAPALNLFYSEHALKVADYARQILGTVRTT